MDMGVAVTLGYWITLFLSVIPGVYGDDFSGIVAAGTCAGLLAIIIFFIIPIACYIRYSRQGEKTDVPKQPLSNGHVRHPKQNGVPMHAMNGTKRMYPPIVLPFHGYRGMSPYVGTFRGPAPRPVIIGSYVRPRHHYPSPMMMNPYFFRPPYQQIIYEYESDDDHAPSQRSTLRQHRERYHGSFFGAHSATHAPKMVINTRSSSRSTFSTEQIRDVGEVESGDDQPVEVTETRRKSKSADRSESRSISPEVPTRSPVGDTETETFHFSAEPKAGDILFHPPSPKQERKQERTEPVDSKADYTYASVIKPPQPEPEQTTAWTAPDEDMRPPSPKNPLRMSMSQRLEDIVAGGWEGKPMPYEPDEIDETDEPVQLRKPRTDQKPPTPPLDIPSNTTTPRTSYIRPPTPPFDVPSNTTTPRTSYIRPPTPPLDIPQSPTTPPFDYEQSSIPTANKNSLGRLSQSQAQNDTRGLFTSQVLQELRLRQKSTDKEDDEDDHRAVKFSSQPPGIIPRSEPNSPRESLNMNQQNVTPSYGDVPQAPPPPPPPPPLPK